MVLQKLLGSYINILLPSSCAACGKSLAAYPLPVCPRCLRLILAKNPPAIQSSNHLKKIWSCRPYEDVVRECIKKFKYREKRHMMIVFENMIRKFLSENNLPSDPVDLIVPVPLHPIRRHARGYNQSELISEALSGRFSAPVCSHALIKTKNTVPQMGLSRKNRIKNLKNSFAVVDRLYLVGKSILLVDDIMTTGATLDTCAVTLLGAGVKEVFAFTLARTL
ncbi:ComF family protein [Candidatus Omnitrophota bacterium]